MGNKDKNKDQGDSGQRGSYGRRHHKPSGCLLRQSQSQLGERSQGHHLSQAGKEGHSKGDGQGSHTLPGLTQ